MFWLCYGEYNGQRELKMFLKYVQARLREKIEEINYRVYMTDSVKAIFKALGGHMPIRYFDMISEAKEEKEEDRSPEEIVENIRDKLNKLMEE